LSTQVIENAGLIEDQTFMLDDCYSLKERDKKGRIVEGKQAVVSEFHCFVFYLRFPFFSP
jgi:hypothetical protein